MLHHIDRIPTNHKKPCGVSIKKNLADNTPKNSASEAIIKHFYYYGIIQQHIQKLLLLGTLKAPFGNINSVSMLEKRCRKKFEAVY